MYDISLDIYPGMYVYPGDPEFSATPASLIGKSGFAVSRFTIGSHTGTHVDAPSHIFKDGLSIEQVSLECLIGKAKVIEVLSEGSISTDQLLNKSIKKETEFFSKRGTLLY